MELSMIDASQIDAAEYGQRLQLDEEELMKLAASIRDEGLRQPIGVKHNEGRFTVIFGHRRLEACKRVGLQKIPAVILTGDEVTLRKATFAENFFRANLTPIEQAAAIADEITSGRMTKEQVADGFKRTVDWVNKQMAIVTWPEDCLEAVHSGDLSVAAAANLAMIEDEQYRAMLVDQARDNGATARTTASWLQGWRAMMPPEQAMEQQPVEEGRAAAPMVPKGMCVGCRDVFRVDELNYLPFCPRCLVEVRSRS